MRDISGNDGDDDDNNINHNNNNNNQTDNDDSNNDSNNNNHNDSLKVKYYSKSICKIIEILTFKHTLTIVIKNKKINRQIIRWINN